LKRRSRRAHDAHARTALALALLLGGAVGCVSAGTYDEVVGERDALAARVARLEASNESLSAERVALLEGLEDLREEQQTLTRDVRKLRKERERLARSLEAREAELARQNEEVARLRGTYDALVSDLESEVAAGEIEIQQLREGLRVNVSDAILFPSGSATLNERGRAVLLKVAEQLAKLDHVVLVEGHTDNVPIRGSLTRRYPTNWELAGARAARVARLFEEHGVSGDRLTVLSFADKRPVASNDTPEGRALNRRIEIRLKPRDAADAAARPASDADAREPAAGGSQARSGS